MQRPVQELAPVVTVEAGHLKRHHRFEFLQLAEDGVAALVPDRAVFRPPAEQLGEGQAVHIVAGRGVVAVGHRVHRDGAWLGRIGRAAARGHLVTQERAGPRGTQAFLGLAHAGPRCEDAGSGRLVAIIRGDEAAIREQIGRAHV